MLGSPVGLTFPIAGTRASYKIEQYFVTNAAP